MFEKIGRGYIHIAFFGFNVCVRVLFKDEPGVQLDKLCTFNSHMKRKSF